MKTCTHIAVAVSNICSDNGRSASLDRYRC